MRDFLDLLETVYAICVVLVIAFALVLIPIALAVNFTPWWAVTEIVTAPVGLALLVQVAIKIDNW